MPKAMVKGAAVFLEEAASGGALQQRVPNLLVVPPVCPEAAR
eukprot:SAG31_NODE_3162_length_4606_cov_22.721544_4_plen_42_part_00